MATITQTANTDSVWNGTVLFNADPAVTHIVLYAANVDQKPAYRRVLEIANAGPGPNALGGASGISYARLFLQTPTRTFYLRATQKRGANGPEDDLVSAANPVLAVTPSAIKGWTLSQLLEQGLRPTIVVGYDPVTGLYFPLNVVSDAGNGYKLKT